MFTGEKISLTNRESESSRPEDEKDTAIFMVSMLYNIIVKNKWLVDKYKHDKFHYVFLFQSHSTQIQAKQYEKTELMKKTARMTKIIQEILLNNGQNYP
jgi:hypothetical protein